MKALITGGAGYIGSTVSHHLLDYGHDVTIIDDLSTGSKQNIPKKASFFKIDIADIKKLEQIFFKKKFDIIYHFASFIDNEESLKSPKKYFHNNYKKSKIFIECCLRNNINKFIYSSTASVYGDKLKKIKENNELKPLSPYSKSKLKMENFLKKKRNKINCIILRYFNVAGVDKKYRCGFSINNKSNLIVNLCSASVKNKLFVVNGNNFNTKDGTTIRDYIHVVDLAEIHLLLAKKLLKKKIFRVLNCGYGYGFSVKEILEKFQLIERKKIKVKIGKRRLNDIALSIADPVKLRKYILWKPKYNNLTHIVKSSLNWYKKQSR